MFDKINMELSIAPLKDIQRNATVFERKRGEAGFFDGDIHPRHGLPLAQIAADNNYGFMTPEGRTVPPRPFFSLACDTADSVVKESLIKGVGRMLSGDRLPDDSLRDAAENMAMWIGIYAESNALYIDNAPYTVKKKGFNRPLWETGYMATHIKSRVTNAMDS